MKNLFKKFLVGFGVVALAIVLLITGIAIFSGEEQPDFDAPAVQRDTLGPLHREAFLEGCYDGSNLQFCTCAFDYMDEVMTNKEYRALIDTYSKTGETNDVFWEAIEYCAPEEL